MINKVRHYFNLEFSFLGTDQAGRPAPAGQGVTWPLHPHGPFNASRSSLSRWHGCGHSHRQRNLSAHGRENHQNQATSSCSGTVWRVWAKLSAISIEISVLIVHLIVIISTREGNGILEQFFVNETHIWIRVLYWKTARQTPNKSNNCYWQSFCSYKPTKLWFCLP